MKRNAPPADAAERERATHERARNVIVDAGAGTGKTTLLIARLMHLLAPADDGPALPLERIAAITFTRKAAGELKLRLREALLMLAAHGGGTAQRRERTAHALEALDNAALCTVHSFADRMLRLRPADAQLSPEYEIAEDPSALVEETYAGLLHAAEHDELEPEACETLRMFQGAGLLARTIDNEWYDRLGLDAFVRDVIQTRDRALTLPELRAPDLAAVRRCCRELQKLVQQVGAGTDGGRALRRLGAHCQRLGACDDVSEALRLAIAFRKELKSKPKKAAHFADDPDGWEACRWIWDGVRKRKQERSGGPLGKAIIAPLMAHMAERLMRLRPLILARYARVKRSHAVVDQIDLLVELRDLLQRDLAARAFYQQRFDHVLVDEFQDTDPLQAEIVCYLCEDGAHAARASDAALRPGKLTIVGDPKQSIYRFRRADIAMYASVCERLRESDACEAQLSVNFRSAPSILTWLNAGFDAVLGTTADGPLFDPEHGTVKNTPLMAASEAGGDPGVHVLSFGDASQKFEEARDLEGEALAHYIRHLVEASALTITDPHTRATRKPRYGDVAVVMIATQTVQHLTTELDRLGVPHVVRGGTLFMRDALHRQFLLGLCALADPGDGVAQAALWRPPFFALPLEELVRARVAQDEGPAYRAAKALISSLRAARQRVTPGEMARRVLEQSGFGAYAADGVNGAQRLARLYELCRALDELARSSRLDFDGVMAVARGWIDAPPRIDAPLPVDADAVQVITAHQAKGLEWPIVAFWDGRAGWRAFLPQVSLTVDAVSGGWALQLDGLEHDPSGAALQKRERELLAAERKRVAYVAATRARELFIVPEAGEPSDRSIAGTLLRHAAEAPQLRVARYERDGEGWWQNAHGVSTRPIAPARAELQAAWASAVAAARQPYRVPSGVTSAAHQRDIEGAAEAPRELRGVSPRLGRHGPIFGSTVHRALQLLLMKQLSAEDATRRAAVEHALPEHHDIALGDVQRTRAALRGAGLLEHTLRLEYPIAGSLQPETLLTGYLDLLAASANELVIIDFKTDPPPTAAVQHAYPEYVAQVRTYQQLLEATAQADDRRVRAALLFTASGALHWI
jgi:ATP-dependent helicase/nuclease subunit A